MTRLRIETPSRLHFGLLGWGPGAVRQFGGVGLLIDRPGISLEAETSPSPIAEGPLVDRVQTLLEELPERFEAVGLPRPNASIKVEVLQASDEHAGFGTGTQLCLAVARAALELGGLEELSSSRALLAKLAGRGVRSGIGIHGFYEGGLIVDGGRGADDEIPPLLARHPFPDNWSILIVRPSLVGLHGDDERRAFATLPAVPERLTERLCRLVLLDLLTGVVERDLPGFGVALGEIQRLVGDCFKPVQGGIYASEISAAIVEELDNLGLHGAGQSSWGPTLYAFSEADDRSRSDLARRVQDRFNLSTESVYWTRASNHGATVNWSNHALKKRP